jgi:hypothetical protein
MSYIASRNNHGWLTQKLALPVIMWETLFLGHDFSGHYRGSWDMIWDMIWHTIWDMIWHTIWHMIWHTIWHMIDVTSASEVLEFRN